MTTPDLTSTTGVSFENVTAGGDIIISGVTVQNITQMAKRPPLWVNVPRLPAQLVGRDQWVETMTQRLRGGNAVSVAVHGLPGVGKSALAVVLAHHPDVLACFSDGVLWAGLGPAPDVMSVLAAWGDALGVDVTKQPSPGLRSQAVGNAIGQARLALVIDDAWQLEQAQLLRCGGPNCAHLLTTRDLTLAHSFASRQYAISVPVLEDEPAFSLLQSLAPEACAVDPKAARQLTQVVGGLPLELGLLGSFLNAPEHSLFPELGIAALGEMADPGRRLALASVRLGSLDGRQVTLQQTIALSLEGLPQATVEVYYALGAFAPKPATFNLAAAKAVTRADAASLATLVARGLVEQAGPETLALHQTLANVARTGMPKETAERHWDCYLSEVLKDRDDWQHIEEAYPQILWAWRCQMAADSPIETLLALIYALSTYQDRRGLWQDQLAWAKRGLEMARAAGRLKDVVLLVNNIGKVYSDLGDKAKALSNYEEALPLFRQVGDKAGEATTLNNIGKVYSDLGDKAKALSYYEEALPLFRQVGDKAGEATTLNNIGKVYSDLGDKAKALSNYEEALPLRRQVGDKAGEATTLCNIGAVYDDLGDKAKALSNYEEALPLFRQVGDKAGEAVTLNNIGKVYSDLGDKAKALSNYEEALPLFRQVGDKAGEATTLNNIGKVYSDLGDKAKALSNYEEALPLRRQVGDKAGEATTLCNIGKVYSDLGDKAKALSNYEEALSFKRQVGDKAGEATTLNNIGVVYDDLGDKAKALSYYQKALPLSRQVGDPRCEGVTRYNLAMVYETLGDLAQAEAHLLQVVALDEATGHPDLESDRAALTRIQVLRKGAAG